MALNDRQIEDIANRLWDWLGEEDKRQDAAAKLNRDLVQVHRDGWKNTADAITRGFAAVAEAIRRN